MTSKQYSIFDNLMEGVQVISPAWEYLYINEAAALQGKFKKEELLGHTMTDKYPGIEQTQMFTVLRECMENRKGCHLINQFDFPDGSSGYFDLRIQVVPDGLLILSFDISREKNMEHELKHLNEDLERHVNERTRELLDALDREKELHEIKSNFISLASHQFRTPLSVILSSIALLERYDDSERKVKHIERIKSSIKEIDDVLEHLLSFEKLIGERPESGRQQFDIPHLTEDLIREMRHLTKRGQTIHYSHYGDTNVITDQRILRSVLYNLISNALRYSKGSIEVYTETQPAQIFVSVSDQGETMTEDHLDSLFKLSSADYSENRTALGLSIVKRYVDMLGGTMAFNGVPDTGNTFIVHLPNSSE